MATANAAPENMKLDRSDGSATLELYRAALGPLHTDYYLKAFTRFDALGKTSPQWNWTAALLTLNWLLFRQLWLAALAYGGAVVAVALLLVGIARLVFQVSVEVQWLLAGVAVLLAIAVPGAYGNTWLYAACNKKMERALVDSATLEEACAGLEAKAPGRRRMAGLLGSNLALLLMVGAAALSWHNRPTPTLEANEPVRAVPVELLQSGLATQSAVAATAPGASAPAALAPATQSSTPMVVTATTPVPTAVPASRISQGVVQTAPLPMAQTAPLSVALTQTPQATGMTTAITNKPKAAESAKTITANQAKPESALNKPGPSDAKATKPAQPVSQANATTAAETYQINVGLFADANNARNAQAKLRDAGLPVLSQEIKSAKGSRTRVRVGPFETLAEADRVAEKVRSLKLEAVVVQP